MKKEYRVIANTKQSETASREHVMDCEKTTTVEDVHTWLNFLSTYHGPTTKLQIAKLIH